MNLIFCNLGEYLVRTFTHGCDMCSACAGVGAGQAAVREARGRGHLRGEAAGGDRTLRTAGTLSFLCPLGTASRTPPLN